MNKTFPISLRSILLLGFLSISFLAAAKKETPKDSVNEAVVRVAKLLDSLNCFDKSIPYQTGSVDVKDFLTLNIPAGYKFIPEKQAQEIVTGIWGNPEDKDVIGMVVPADYAVTNLNSWAFVVSYEESGYVKDKDAKDIDYGQMLKDIQADEAENNKKRVAAGYESIHLVDWAVKPFYDNDRKVLHWAKKLQFGDKSVPADELTLNYDVRILGRKGVLSMNAVGNMGQLPVIREHIPDVLAIASFKKGYAYSDFNPSMDKVAAYTIGGLIAGKLLAKAGLFVLLLKNIKLVIIAILSFFGAFRKKIANLFGRKKKEDDLYATATTTPQPEEPELAPVVNSLPADTAHPSETPVNDNQNPI